MIIIALGLSITDAVAQRYGTAAGLRIERGEKIGMSFQQRLLDRTTLEAILAAGGREVEANFLVEQHFPIIGRGLNFYLGAGGHIGALKDYGGTWGIDGVMGIEHKILILPLVISLDFKPAYQVNHEDWFNFSTAFSIRYILIKYTNREKAKRQRLRQKEKEDRRDERQEKGGFFDFLKNNRQNDSKKD